MAATSSKTDPVRLTRRELEVAELVAQGLTNREIAQRLFISERTADGHLEHIREKLGVSSRAQVAAWIVQREAVPSTTIPVPSSAGRSIPTRVHLSALAAALIVALTVALIVGGVAWRAGVLGHATRSAGPPIDTFAGVGSVKSAVRGGYSGDFGPATAAQLSRPTDLVVGGGGFSYIVDSGNRVIRRVNLDGSIITLAGGGTSPPTDGALATSVGLGYPSHIALDTHGALYISLSNAFGAEEVWRLNPDSTIWRVLGDVATGSPLPAGPGTAAGFLLPAGGLVVAPTGTLYVANRRENQVTRLGSDGVLSRYVGTGQSGYSGDGGAAAGAQLNSPLGLALDNKGSLYIADSGNNRVRRVDSVTGIITTVAGSSAAYGDTGDEGQATKARLALPAGVVIGSDGSIYIADTGNNRVRRVSRNGVITAVAGSGKPGFSGDGRPAAAAMLNGPSGLSLGKGGSLYIADSGNHRIRKVEEART
jgi:DNA-binding CsgD family transcriptional regulator/sugar lactone lactonase YvrE